MRKITVFNSLTLDGVMQSPGHPDEDRRDGFEHGGWAQPYFDPVMAERASEGMSRGGTFLFGRQTYEQFATVWPQQGDDNPFAASLNRGHKYVASTTLREPLPWANSTLLAGDAGAAVASLRRQPGDDIVILGSGVLIRSLMAHDLIDEYVLQVHPLVLGTGRRLFADGTPLAKLRLVGTKTTSTGVIIATYQPARS
jgi:dihydrofolate reductase